MGVGVDGCGKQTTLTSRGREMDDCLLVMCCGFSPLRLRCLDTWSLAGGTV